MVTPRLLPLVIALLASRAPAAATQQPGQDSTQHGASAVGSIRGEVFDSLVRQSLEGAHVRVVGTALHATTDRRGRFRIDSVPAGSRVLVVEHPALDSAGLSDLPRRIEVAAGRTTRTVLAVPALRTLFAAACGRSPAPPGTDSGIVFGAVRDAERGIRLAGARVMVSWVVVERPRGELQVSRRVRDTLTDSLGNYYACSVAKDVELRVQASAGRFASGVLDLEVGHRRVLRHDLSVSREALAETVDTGTGLRGGLATLVGSVRGESGQPLGEVMAGADGAPHDAVTDATGRFVLAGLPSGSRMVYVRRIGYRFGRTSVDLRNRDTTYVFLELSAVTLLDTIRVTAVPWVRSELDELERRLHGGSRGVVLTAQDLRPLWDVRTAFYGLPSLFVQWKPGGFDLYGMVGARLCAVAVWIDGMRQSIEVLQTYRPSDLIALEVYSRGWQAPMRYQGGECGVVLAWTRYLQ